MNQTQIDACPSCNGLNISCPDGCGRDPKTGELNGTRLERTEKSALKTHIIEAKYNEADDAGGYVGIVRAYSDDQAMRMIAMQMIIDNEWDEGDAARQYTSLLDAFNEELTILYYRHDAHGSMCPNCSSEDTSRIEAGRMADGEVVYVRSLSQRHEDLRCNSCGYHWIPVGFHHDVDQQTEAEIDVELAEFERLMTLEPWEREE